MENKHPAWLDEIIVVTKGSKEQHKKELVDILTRLENAGYRLSESKSEFFKTEIEWIGHKYDQNSIRPLQDKLMTIKILKQPKNEKELKSILGAIQYLSKYIDNLSAQTDSLRQLLKKDTEWLWTEEHTGLRKSKTKDHRNTVFGSLQFRLPKRDNNRRQYKRPRCDAMTRTTGRKIKTDWFRKPISI